MERKVGEIFTCNGKTYQVVKGSKCENCDINGHCVSTSSIVGLCFRGYRSDNTNIIFKEVNNMEIKNNQLTIDIPEGMEIDLENSDLAKGIIKFRDKWLTLERIHGSTKEDCYLTNRCGIKDYHNNKLVAIANLMNIARYFNGDWNYNANDDKTMGYAIYYSTHGVYHYTALSPQTSVYYGIPMFKNKDVDMTKRIIGKLHPVRYVVQDNMLFGCIPFIYITRKTFSTVDEARKYVGEPCDEYLFY